MGLAMGTTRSDHAALTGASLVRAAVRRQRRLLWLAIAAAVVYQGSFLLLPLVTGRALDVAVLGGDTAAMPGYVAALMMIAFVRALAGAARKRCSGGVGAALGADLRARLYQHLQRLSFSFHDRVGAGQLMSRASSDISAIEQVVTMIPFMVQVALLGVGGAIVLFVMDPVLAAAVVAVIVIVSVVPLQFGGPIRDSSRAFQDRLGELSDYLEQQINGIEVVKGHGFEDVQIGRGGSRIDAVRNEGVRLSAMRAAFQSAFGFAPTLAVVLVLTLGGWFGVQGRLTPGELFAFLQYLGMLMAPVHVLAAAMGMVPLGAAAADRVAEVLATEPEIVSPHHAVELPTGHGRVQFEHVRFGYRPDQPVLRELTLDIPAGSRVALVGISGSGKSTLSLLIPRFYDPWQGTVRLDGVPVDRVDLDVLRHAVAMVFEDTVVFNATVRANLAMARPRATNAEILRAAKLAQADRFIREMPDGYETLLGDEGVGLSGGQRQRLSIARAILRNPRVLILDDATSALDPQTDAEIREGLGSVMQGRTTIIIAHRLETVALADRVVLLEDGRIVADGVHEDLLHEPAYREALALDEAGVF